MCFYQGTSDIFRNPVFCWRLCLYNVDWNCEIFYVFNSSRTKNMMWYGVLGTKELVQKTYKNLEQRVQLEVWAQRMKDADIRAECISRFLTFNGKRKHSLCHLLHFTHMNDALALCVCVCTCTCTVHPCKWSWFHVSNVVLRSYTSCNLSLFVCSVMECPCPCRVFRALLFWTSPAMQGALISGVAQKRTMWVHQWNRISVQNL